MTRENQPAENGRAAVEITSMKYLEKHKVALAVVKYGEFYLNNIIISEKDGEKIVHYPEKKRDAESYPIYKLSDKKEFDYDKKAIESALKINFAKAKVAENQHITHIPIKAIKFNKDYEPRIVNPVHFEDGNAAMSVAYKSLMVNNVHVKNTEDGERQFVSMPARKVNDEWKSHVTTNKNFSEKIMTAFHEKMVEKEANLLEKQVQGVDENYAQRAKAHAAYMREQRQR